MTVETVAWMLGGAVASWLVYLAVGAFRSALRSVSDTKSEMAVLQDRLSLVADAANGLHDAISELGGHVALMEGYVKGFAATCEAMVAQYEKLTTAVVDFKGALLPPKSDGEDFEHYDEETANRAFFRASHIAEGYTREEADALARADERAAIVYNKTPGF